MEGIRVDRRPPQTAPPPTGFRRALLLVERANGFVRLPGQGPILTWRGVCDAHMPALADWDLTMGDVELF